MTTLQLDGAGLAEEIKAEVRTRLEVLRLDVQRVLAPRLEEVSTLLAQFALLRISAGRAEPTLEERTLLARWKLLSAGVELAAVDALQDSVERTVARVIRAGFGLLATA